MSDFSFNHYQPPRDNYRPRFYYYVASVLSNGYRHSASRVAIVHFAPVPRS